MHLHPPELGLLPSPWPLLRFVQLSETGQCGVQIKEAPTCEMVARALRRSVWAPGDSRNALRGFNNAVAYREGLEGLGREDMR